MAKRLFVFFFFSSIVLSAFSQRTSVEEERTFSPKTASLLSTAFPGAGQVYNQKYWKAPLALGAVAAGIYFIVYNTNNFKIYKEAYIVSQLTPNVNIKNLPEGEGNIEFWLEEFRRRRDLSYVLTGVLYLINIVDASVDAHFKEFDVSEDLSLRIDPLLIPKNNSFAQHNAIGLSLTFNF
jgi:hypothetical protein